MDNAKDPEESTQATLAARVLRNSQRLAAAQEVVDALYASFPVTLLQFAIEFLQVGTDEARRALFDRVMDYLKHSIRQLAANSKDVRLGMVEYAEIEPQLKMAPSADRLAVRKSMLELHDLLTKWSFQMDGWLQTLATVRNLISIWPWQTEVVYVAQVIYDNAEDMRDDSTYLKGVLVRLDEGLQRFLEDSNSEST